MTTTSIVTIASLLLYNNVSNDAHDDDDDDHHHHHHYHHYHHHHHRSSYKNSGTITPLNPSVIRIPSLVDYLKGGLRMNLIIGIDFTGSNGAPDAPTSLHYYDRSGYTMNQYQQAILAIGNILKDYSPGE